MELSGDVVQHSHFQKWLHTLLEKMCPSLIVQNTLNVEFSYRCSDMTVPENIDGVMLQIKHPPGK